MSATGQGQGAAGGDAAAQGQQQGEGAQQQGGPDFGQIMQQMGTLAQGQEDLRQFLQSAPWQGQEDPGQQQQQQQEPDPIDLSFLDMGDPGFNPDQASERLAGIVQQLVQQGVQEGVQQHVQPLSEQLAQQRRQAQLGHLVAEFPELGDAQTYGDVQGLSRQYAEMIAAQIGDERYAALAHEPLFMRVVYAAGRAFDQAAQEQQQGSGDPGAATLEGGGGAAPGGGAEGDAFDRMLKAKRGSSALPFG